jgi:putative integral membrane protein (TIGR02587 family)
MTKRGADDGSKGGGEAEATAPAHSFRVDLARNFGGALIFSFPLLMTMEMWWLGFYMDRFRLALFLAFVVVLVSGLSYFEGGEETLKIEVLDAFVACAVGYVVSAAMLSLLAIIGPGMSADEVIGKISLHAAPGSIGAILARRLLEVEKEQEEEARREWYGGRIFLMGVGAIFLAFQLAPTEEMVLIAHQMTGWHAAALALFSLALIQAFTYAVELRERGAGARGGLFRAVFWRFAVVGYAVALLLSLYVLWTFGRLEGMEAAESVMATIVLGFPAALGAAASRLIL